jgi:UDP-2,3-diacylglucosamine hydrolase
MAESGSPRPTLFLSDLHLSPDRPAAVAAFHAFVDGPARAAAAVYILGDLFDWWIGDDQLREPFIAPIVKSMRTLADSGVPLFVARGNRDFMLGGAFEDASGATLLPEQVRLELHGVPTLISHGDELCTDDAEYQAYRARVRTPEAMRRLLRLPYFVRRLMAAWLRRKSSSDKSLKPEYIMDVNAGAVADAFRRHDAQRMIHGHTHRPDRHRHDVDGASRERWVMADWHDSGQYLEVDAHGVHEREIAG